MTSKEDNHRRREPYRKTERRHHRNLTLQDDSITGKKWQEETLLANQSCTELGPTQPQLVLQYFSLQDNLLTLLGDQIQIHDDYNNRNENSHK